MTSSKFKSKSVHAHLNECTCLSCILFSAKLLPLCVARREPYNPILYSALAGALLCALPFEDHLFRVCTVEVKKSLRSICVPFLLPFAFSLPLQLPCACIMHLHIPLFFYSVSSSGGREYAASGSHHVRGPDLLSCTWKWVVTT